jgi:hypothetical protein
MDADIEHPERHHRVIASRSACRKALVAERRRRLDFRRVSPSKGRAAAGTMPTSTSTDA